MTTEIESTPTTTAASSNGAAAHAGAEPPALTIERRPLWRRRRYQVGATLLAIVVFIVAVGFNLLARQYTPDGAVRSYLTALQSGNALEAWDQVQVSAPTAQATATLIDRSAMQAALAAGRPDIKSFNITSTSQIDAATSSVSFDYDTSAGTKQAKFVVRQGSEKRFGFYPLWHIVIAPTMLQITLPAGSNGVTIDGRSLALPEGASSVAVLPLVHKFLFNGTQILAPQTVTLDAFLSIGQLVAYQPQLTAAGQEQAKIAVKGFFDNCAKLTSANVDPAVCPQDVTFYLAASGQWRVVGDASQDLAIKFDQQMNGVGTGHFQMVFSYQGSGSPGASQIPSAGAYSASLVLSPTGLTVANVQRAKDVAALTRPAGATDQAAKDLVAAAMTQCATVQAEYVADCPQRAPDAGLSNVRWTLNGDPIAGATVSFEPNSGVFTVHGNFNMSVSYYWLGSHPKSGNSYITAYDAHLLWDGQNLQLVNIDGAVS
jgi:hypothetical protein